MCAVSAPLGCTDRHGRKDSSAQVSSGGADIFVPRWLLCAPLLASEIYSRIYRHLLRWYRDILSHSGILLPQSPIRVQSVPRHTILSKAGFPFSKSQLLNEIIGPRFQFGNVSFGLERSDNIIIISSNTI